MRDAWWNPRDERPKRATYERPWLEAPNPYAYMPLDPPRAHGDDEDGEEAESPRVIIIDI